MAEDSPRRLVRGSTGIRTPRKPKLIEKWVNYERCREYEIVTEESKDGWTLSWREGQIGQLLSFIRQGTYATKEEALDEHMRLTERASTKKYNLTSFANTITEEGPTGQYSSPTKSNGNGELRSTRHSSRNGPSSLKTSQDDDRFDGGYDGGMNGVNGNRSGSKSAGLRPMTPLPLVPIALAIYVVIAYIFWSATVASVAAGFSLVTIILGTVFNKEREALVVFLLYLVTIAILKIAGVIA